MAEDIAGSPGPSRRDVLRRGLFLGGAAVVGGAVGAVADHVAEHHDGGGDTVPFYGAHQGAW
ncbi:hypothetical protein [Tsukamurella soli]|uniref:hypothetical protein n=1 Tax=Tsukamurella soli TaxID=644556 RepID=UPI003608D8DB